MQKYEYKIEEIFVKGNVKTMNKLGQEGWELVSVYNSNMYFKRKIEENENN